jgi:hypothetical protein
MKENRKHIELIAVVTCLVFAVAMSFYHLFSTESLGLSSKTWALIWAIIENGLPISICIVVSLLTTGFTKFIFKWLFPVYFFLRFFYHLSCYLGIYLISQQGWKWLYSIELVILIIVGLICCVFYLRTENEDI